MARFGVGFIPILLFVYKLRIIGTTFTDEKHTAATADYHSIVDNSAHIKLTATQLNAKYNTDDNETSIIAYNNSTKSRFITDVHSSSDNKNHTLLKINLDYNGTTLSQNNINTNHTLKGENNRNVSDVHVSLNEENNGTSAFEQHIIDMVDVPENETFDLWNKQHLTYNATTEHHNYYNSTTYVNREEVQKIWNEMKNITSSNMLSQSHRRAMTVQLSFDFPFYGHLVRNVTVATGGFIYTGDYVHPWLAATQFIAPLMANFDTSLSNESFVRLNDSGSSFTVLWENVHLQDKHLQDVGKFSFSAKLYKNGDIMFTYFSVPISLNAIHDDKHPVKVGLSDAYIIDKVIHYARRKTIYEYHRVNFADLDIVNSTIIYLKALPTCLQYTDCVACLSHDTTFDCTWCPVLNRCSTGTDRKKQDWLNKGCHHSQITVKEICPPIGARGNNATFSNVSNHLPSLTASSNVSSNLSNKYTGNYEQSRNGSYVTNAATSTIAPIETVYSQAINKFPQQKMIDHSANSKGLSLTLGVFGPIFLIACAILWVLYAYRNPHTKSGQLLIQYRPNQWSWRRGEARYTAATIHM